MGDGCNQAFVVLGRKGMSVRDASRDGESEAMGANIAMGLIDWQCLDRSIFSTNLPFIRTCCARY